MIDVDLKYVEDITKILSYCNTILYFQILKLYYNKLNTD